MRRRKKAKKQKLIHHPITLILLFLILVFVARATFASFSKKERAEEEYARFAEEYHELVERRTTLQENIEYLNTERGREEAFRTRFNVSREGETILRIIEPEQEEGIADLSTGE